MVNIYKCIGKNQDELVATFQTQCEGEALNEYIKHLKFNDISVDNVEFLGETRGMVFRLDFKMILNGEVNEYFLIQSLKSTC